MAEATVQAGSNRLPIIATSINDHLAAAKASMRRGVEHAIASGALLIEAKGLVAHGEWVPWLQANCNIGPRQAQTYMRLARNRHKLEALKTQWDSFLTIASAEALVGRPRAERPHGLPHQLDLAGPDWEVTAPAVIANPVSDRERASHHIANLEYAIAVIRRASQPRLARSERDKQRARLAAAANVIEATIAFLREREERRPDVPDRPQWQPRPTAHHGALAI
jgi:hypothetical protein